MLTYLEICIFCAYVCCLIQVTKVTLSSDASRKMASWLSVMQISDQSSQQTLWGRKALGSMRSCHTWVWRSQIFSLLLTWRNEHFAVSTYGIRKEGQKGSGISLASFLWLARTATPRTGQLRPKCFVKSKFWIKFWFLLQCCLFYHVHLITIDSTYLDTELEIWDMLHYKI